MWHKNNQNEWPEDFKDFETSPDELIGMKYAARSAAYFWVKHNLAAKADEGPGAVQVNAITAIVNLRTDSYAARVNNFNAIHNLGILKATSG
jgi:predicted chitinase